MTYISMSYYLLVLVVLVLYYFFPIRHRWIALLVGNIAFYFLYFRTGSLIFGVTIIVSYIAGIYIHRFRGKKRKLALLLSLLLVISPWVLTKIVNSIPEVTLKEEPISWIIPIGISFYTLQLIAYLVDVYNDKIIPERNIARFALFVSFFPQLIQGPIPRYGQLHEQLITGHELEERNIVKGFCYIIWGFFLKLVIADKAGIIVNTVYDNYSAYSGVYIWIASILYSVQLYTDFMACSTLAQGVARMFGIEMINNFARPYFAVSIKDFWHRWHISLSSWLKDYIYIPLGGNRSGTIKKYVFIIITFIVSGIWHGVGYKYLAWGGMHAFYQITGDLTYKTRERLYAFLKISPESWEKKTLKQIGTFLLVNWAWIIFRADSLWLGLSMIKHMLVEYNPWILFNDQIFTLGLCWKEVLILFFSIALLWKVGACHEKGISISERIMAQRLIIRWCIFMAAIIGIMIFGTYGYEFNAQEFIYGGF